MDEVGSALIHAVRAGDLQETTALIDSYGLSYSPDWSPGYTLLMVALDCKNSAMAKLLIAKGCSVRRLVPILYGRPSDTPLHLAVRNGDMEIIRLLMNQGASIEKNHKGETPIGIAVRMGCLQTVDHFLNLTAVDYTMKDYLDLLHTAITNEMKTLACNTDFDEIFNLLLKKVVDILASDKCLLTPLHIATKQGSKDVVNFFLKRGEQVDGQDKCGKTCLYYAVERGNLAIVEAVLKFHPDISNTSNQMCLKIAVCSRGKGSEKISLALLDYGFTISPGNAKDPEFLHGAVQNGNYAIVRDLLENGADANAVCARPSRFKFLRSEMSSLHRAVKNRDERMAELLINNKADVNAQDENGMPPVFYSVENMDVNMTQLLLNNGTNVKELNPEAGLLHLAVRQNTIEIVEALLLHGADINAEDKYGKTALHYTVLNNMYNDVYDTMDVDRLLFSIWRGRGLDSEDKKKMEILQLLLSRGADVDAQIRNAGLTALHVSVMYGSEPVVDLLLRYKANVNLPDKEGVTPIHFSVQTGNLGISSLLLDMGAEVNAQKTNGDTALHLAVASGNENMVRMLLERGVHVNCRGMRERSPLHSAAWANKTGIVDALLEFGAEVNSKCEDGITALHYSARSGAIETVTSLIEYGADVNITCDRFQTPLDYATNEVPIRHSRYNPCEDTLQYLSRHHVKMEVAGLVAAGFWPSLCPPEKGLEDFYSECQLELTRTKSEFIEDTNVSYYDILRKDARCVAKYMKNPSVMLAAESEDYRKTFPLYASIIKSQFRKGLKSVKLLELVESASQILHRLTGLPDVCIEEIVDHLSVDDLKVLMEV